MRKILLSEENINETCKRVAREIEEKIKGEDRIPLLVGVMKGAMNFMMEVIKHITVPIYTDFIQISSYFGTQRTNNVRLLKDIEFDCTNRTVIIVEDIIDSGYSMNFLVDHIKRNGAKNVYVCTLIDKKLAREVEVPIDFCGYVMKEKHFVVGFGLDYNEVGRNIPYIYEVDEEELNYLDDILKKDLENAQ